VWNYIESEPQNIEQEISNYEVWNRYALTMSNKFKSIEYLTSTFIIPCSIFDIRFLKFLSRSYWTLAGRGSVCMNIRPLKHP